MEESPAASPASRADLLAALCAVLIAPESFDGYETWFIPVEAADE